MITRELSSVVLAWIFDIPISSVDYHLSSTPLASCGGSPPRLASAVRKEHAVTNNDKIGKRVTLSVAVLLVQQISHKLTCP
jgi:hypothetical protein